MARSPQINWCVTDCEREIKKLWAEIKAVKKLFYDLGPSGQQGCCVISVNGKDKVVNLTTTDIPEGTNKYFTNQRVQAFSDPRYAFKDHTHILSEITDFPSQTGNAGKVLLTDGTTPYWGSAGIANISATAPIQFNPVTGVISTTLTQYTNEMAQDAVGSILQDSASINFTYDDANNTITAEVNGNYGGLTLQEIRFTVGDNGAPSAGSNTFTLQGCDGQAVTGKRVEFFRERELQIVKNSRDYSYNLNTGEFTLTNQLQTGEDCVFKFYPTSAYSICEYPIVPGGFPYTLPLTLS